MLRRVLAAAALLVVVGCQGASVGAPSARPSASGAASAAPSPGARTYGAPLTAAVAIPLAEVLASPARYADQPVTVEGHVRRACSRKGCWMELAGSPTEGPGCRVTFKDYGFFVPTDSAGARARVQGVVQVQTLKASHVEHMESEGATFPNKAPDGTAQEVRLVATGVELTRS